MERPLRASGFIGLATVACAIVVTVLSPVSMGSMPEGLRTPVIAFELAATTDEIEVMFGPRHSPERTRWVSQMRAGTYLDFGLLALYSLFLASVARGLLPALEAAGRLRDPSFNALRRTRAAVTVAFAAAGLDVLENRELLVILDRLSANLGGYEDALARLQWLVWSKWMGLAAWFALLAPELIRARGALRIAAFAGLTAALASVLAVAQRGIAAEVMALGIAIGMVALVPGCLRPLKAP